MLRHSHYCGSETMQPKWYDSHILYEYIIINAAKWLFHSSPSQIQTNDIVRHWHLSALVTY